MRPPAHAPALARALAPALALVGAALLAGCLGEPTSPVKLVAYLPLHKAEPGRATEFAFFVESTSAFKQRLVPSADLPAGWTFEPETAEVVLNGSQRSSFLARITPEPNATFGPHPVGVKLGNTRAEVIVEVGELGERTAAEGKGAVVHWVLFLPNGTLYGTSDKTAWDREGIPRHEGDEPQDFRPLKVYVGGRRGEAPPEPYNSTGCEGSEQPPCYHPVIPGFDARLRGMREGETLAVRVPKELAYTVPGNESHPLYGMDLNFLIRLLQVDELQTRSCTLPVCPRFS